MTTARTGSIAAAMAVLALGACGEDEPAAAPTTTAAATTTAVPRFEVASGRDDVVISLTEEGGFLLAGAAFANIPVTLITGEGLAISAGPVPAVFPGPLLPNVVQRTISPTAVQDLLSRAEELGLLDEVEYERDPLLADAATTVLTITADGETFTHSAYALGIDERPDPARDALTTFVAELTDLPATVGAAELGPEEPFRPSTLLIQATPVDPATIDAGEGEARIVEWPEGPSKLIDAATCLPITYAATPFFEDADQLTYFSEEIGLDQEPRTYQVSVVPRLPGREC